MGHVAVPSIALSPASLSFEATEGGADPATQQFTVANDGQSGSTLNFSVADNAAWLSVAPTSGSRAQGDAPLAITVSVVTGSLAAGVHNATVTVTDAAADDSPQTVAVQFTVAAPDTQPPTLDVTAGPTRARISREPGHDATDITFEADEALVEWEVRSVPSEASPRLDGPIVESGGPLAAGTPLMVTITDDEILAVAPGDGTKGVKFFGRDAAGNWSS